MFLWQNVIHITEQTFYCSRISFQSKSNKIRMECELEMECLWFENPFWKWFFLFSDSSSCSSYPLNILENSLSLAFPQIVELTFWHLRKNCHLSNTLGNCNTSENFCTLGFQIRTLDKLFIRIKNCILLHYISV